MIVLNPPVVAAIGIPMSSALDNGEFFPRLLNSGITAAITIAVTAVLDINMEAIIVVHINPMKTRFGVLPETSECKFEQIGIQSGFR